MIWEWIRFGLCAICLLTAMICFTAAVLGANRFGFIMNRVHAGGIGDTLGLFLVALAIILGDGFHMAEVKMCFIIIFMWFTAPVSSHVLIQVEYFTNAHLYRFVKRDGMEKEISPAANSAAASAAAGGMDADKDQAAAAAAGTETEVGK